MHPLIRCISILLLYIVYTVLSLSPQQTVMIQCRSLTLHTTCYYTMYSIALLCMYVQHPLSRCYTYIHTILSLCVALCVVPPLTGTTYTCGLLQLIYCVIHSIPLLDTVYNTIDVVCYHPSVCMYGIPLVDTIHTIVYGYSTPHKELMVQCSTGASRTHYYVCVCVVSPYQILHIHIHSALLCVLSPCQTTHITAQGACAGALYIGASHTQDYVYSYVCHPLIRWHT